MKKRIFSTMSRTPKKELVVRCDCGEENFLSLMSWAKGWDDEEIDQLYVSCGADNMWKWRDKFRVAWKILRHGTYRNFGVLVGRPDIRKIVKYLQETLDLWDRLEERIKKLKKK